MRIPFLLLCLLPVVAACPVSFAQTADDTVETGRRWIAGSVHVEGSYDDNIMEYSPREIDEATAGLKPTKYLVTDPSDVYGSIGFRLDVMPPVGDEDFRTRIRLRYSSDSYAANPIKDHHLWGVELHQRLTRANYVSLRYDNLPEYYLRNLFYHRYRLLSRYPSHYDRADISRDAWSAEVGRTFNPALRLAVHYAYAKTGYAPEFTERDSRLHAVSLESDFHPLRPLRLSLDYTWSIRWAKGRDNFTDPAYDSLADISAQYNQVSAGASYDLKRIVGLPMGVQGRVTWQREGYLSGKEGDIYHHGRIDELWSAYGQLDYGLFAMVELFLGYRWEQNRTNIGETSDTGNYQAHIASTGVTFSF